jgi:hypothetical protein
MDQTEAPASRRKPPATATPSTYGHRARRRLYPVPGWETPGWRRKNTGEGCQSGGRGENPALSRVVYVEEGGTCSEVC